jgi:general secretion pathway protein G
MKSTQRHGKAAFSLIELMAVVAIIVILAALVTSGLGYVQDKQASSQAKVQMALLSKAIQDYKLDRGVYPPSADTPDGKVQSKELFKALFWDSDADGTGGTTDADQKVYLAELDPASSKQGWTSGTASDSTPILDPWGNEYRYRSAFGATTANINTENPDFDLWSAGKDGKSNPATPSDKVNRDDIKNP